MDGTLSTIKFLSAPFDSENKDVKTWNEPAKSPSSLLSALVDKCLENVQLRDASPNLNYIENSENSPTWKYTCLILEVLAQLKHQIEETEENMSEFEKSIEVLSLQSQIYVQKCVELVVGFGILPYLFPGIGMPEKLRKVNTNFNLFILEDKNVPQLEQFFRLSHVVKSLLFLASHPSFSPIIFHKYTCDILSALLQLCRSPLKKPVPCPSSSDAKKETALPQNSNPGLTFEEYSRVLCVREELNNLFYNQFLISSPRGTLVNSLLLIGASVRPRWIGKSCYEILSTLLLSSETETPGTGAGFFAISQAVLESLGRSSVWKVTRVISNLLREAIRLHDDDGKLLQRRLINLSSQAYNMLVTLNMSSNADAELASSAKDPETKEQLITIALTSGLTLFHINPSLALRNFWCPLFKPLLKLTYTPHEDHGQLSISIKELETCIFYAGKLLTLSPAIDFPFPLNSFIFIYSLLFQIFCTFESYLQRKVQDPQVIEVVEFQHRKLQDVLITMFEVLHSLTEIHSSSPSSPSPTSVANIDASSNILSKFCIHLLLNDGPSLEKFSIEETKCDLDLKRFRFDIAEVFDTEAVQLSTTATSSSTLLTDSNRAEVEPVKIIRVTTDTQEDNIMELISEDCAILCSGILKKERIKKVSGKIFCQLLEYADKAEENMDGEKSLSTSSVVELDTASINRSKVLKELDMKEKSDCEKCVAMKLLSDLGSDESLIEDMGVIENPEQTLHFLELIMKKLAFEMDSSLRTGDEYEFGQSVLFSLGILGTMCEAMRESESTSKSKLDTSASVDTSWDDLHRFLPYLLKFRETFHGGLISAGVPQMAEDIILLIDTKGVGLVGKEKIRKTRLESALESVSSPMLPIKGHGLLELRKLLEEKNKDVLKSEEHLLQIFQREIKNEDSYVYLMAIQGMASLGLRFHTIVVPILIEEYGNYDTTTSNKVTKSMREEERAEFRMKVGEALVKIVQRLGEIAPIYRASITNVCFHLVRDEDPLIRASALSNLGELCHLLKFTLGTILTEVWQCVETLLIVEKHVEVRRAALHLMVLLLRGVEKDFTTKIILEDAEIGRYLRDARRLLTRIHETEVDPVAGIHAQLALQEIQLIVKKLLTPSDKLEFNIRVLNTS